MITELSLAQHAIVLDVPGTSGIHLQLLEFQLCTYKVHSIQGLQSSVHTNDTDILLPTGIQHIHLFKCWS